MKGFEEVSCRSGTHALYGYFLDNGSDRNLVLIPGSYTHHSIWEPVIENAGIRANILLIELPGFGKSRPREPDGRIEEFTALSLQVVDAARMGRFFVGGHSIGGMMAIEMLDHAEDRLDGVISCEGWTHASVHTDAFRGLKNETLTEDQMRLRTYYGTIGRTEWTDEEIKRYSQIWRQWKKGRRLLENAAIPILEIWGDRGLAERPGRDRLQIPDKDNIELVWIAHGGHSMLVQYPRLVGEKIAAFVEGVRNHA
jgi:pimeloyl-ACP methyl ester carboxylesterase